MRRFLAVISAFLLAPTLSWAQPELHSGAKGSKPAANPTTSSVDANTNALDVYIQGGGGSGGTSSTFGAAFPATGTAVGAKDSTGTNMAPLNLDASGQLKVVLPAGASGLTDAELRATAVPVSGTVTVTDGSGALNVIVDSGSVTANAGTNLNTSTLLTTTAHDAAFGTAGSADAQVRSIQGVASMTPVQITGTGTAGSAATAVVTVQGIASGTVVPISGTVTVTDGSGALNVIVDSGTTTVTQATATNLNAAVVGTGTAGTAAGGVLTVQGVASMTKLLVTPDANSAVNAQPTPVTTGGLLMSRTVSGASTNATNVKASAGQVYGIHVGSINAAVRYVHLYNNAGTPTCNASIISTFVIPGNAAGAGTNLNFPLGLAFGTGIAFCLTTAVDGTGSVSANEHVVNVEYK